MAAQRDEAATRGLAAAVGAYGLWGVLPLYFRAVGAVPPLEIVAHRIAWSMLLLLVILYFRKRFAGLVEVFSSRRLLLPLVASAILMAGNWLLYIWAVQNGHVIASSLGYFLNPMLNVLLGFAFLRERLTRVQWLAVGFAGAGVAVLAAGAASSLWISLALGGSFAVYGLIRKVIPTGPMVGLSVETMLLLPLALGGLAWWAASGTLVFGPETSVQTDLLLAASGVLTAVPLLLFAFAAQRLTLATMGLVQYLAPTTQFLLGVLLFREPLTSAHLLAFPLIWTGLAIYSWSAWRVLVRPNRV